MVRIALITCILLTACGTEEWVTYENSHFGYTLTMPGDFEARERPVQRVGSDDLGYDYQSLNIVAWERWPRPVIEVAVNGSGPGQVPETIYVFYDFEVREDGSVRQLERHVVVPEGKLLAARAVSFFTDPVERNIYYFSMALEDNTHEPLFVDIVSSFHALR